MDLPICEHDRMHCVDILDALTKHFLGTSNVSVTGAEGDVSIDIKKDRPKDYHPITTTLQLQRQKYLSHIVFKKFRMNVERCRKQRENQSIISLETPVLISNEN
jgi:hypothetical protein